MPTPTSLSDSGSSVSACDPTSYDVVASPTGGGCSETDRFATTVGSRRCGISHRFGDSAATGTALAGEYPCSTTRRDDADDHPLGNTPRVRFWWSKGGLGGCSCWRRGWAGRDRGEYSGDFPGHRNGRADHVPRSCRRQPWWKRGGAGLASWSCTKTSAAPASRRWRARSYTATSTPYS